MQRSGVLKIFKAKGISVFLLFGILVACGEFGRKLEINNGEVYYKSPVTEKQARALGEFLVEDGYFSGKPASVQLIKEPDRYLIRFVVKPKTEDDLDLLHLFRNFGGVISSHLFEAQQVDVELCDKAYKTMHEIKGVSYGILIQFELDKLYYQEPVREEEAQRFMQYLKEQEFFTGKGIPVLLKKTGSVFEMHYPIQEKLEDFAGYLDAVEIFADQISENVFSGASLNIHMCDAYFNTEHVVRSGN